MKKNIFFILSFFSMLCMHAQNDFPYFREWGTYIGGAGTKISNEYKENMFPVDSQGNMFVGGVIDKVAGYTTSYYDQFVLNGPLSHAGSYLDGYRAGLSSSGQWIYGGHTSYFADPHQISVGAGRLVLIDALDHRYYIKTAAGLVGNLATPGVWLGHHTSATGNYTHTFSKYDSAGTLLWTTYLPNNSGEGFGVRIDEQFNLYLSHSTDQSIAEVPTPGVQQEAFVPYLNSANTQGNNGYLVKLNSSGQKIWGTYYTPGILDLEYHNGYLYSFAYIDANIPGSYGTPGTFQPDVPAANLITKWDAATGVKVWETFYAPQLSGYFGLGILDLEVNDTGIYVSGSVFDHANPGYYVTAGAHQSQILGGGDLFLSKFNLQGQRIWSTYYGSTQLDMHLDYNLTVLGNRVIMTGWHYGNVPGLATTGAFLTTPQDPNRNHFFAEFDGTTGARKWASYYGGAGSTNYPADELLPKLLPNGTLILWGSTIASTGIATPGAAFPAMIDPSPGKTFGFMAKFTLKEELSVAETGTGQDLVLYDNPNNGNFYLSGNVLQKEAATVQIYDFAGRLIVQKPLAKRKTQHIALAGKLSAGTYMVKVATDRGTVLKTFKMVVNK